ncbi:MAG TPA: iron-containing redox enzyme family protein [Cryptosporangiaceae bacterium]|nr:iron-containing redox enzyme family protein [Cryptosporangiaceae bacterium]
MRLPQTRGPLSAALVALLRRSPGEVELPEASGPPADTCHDEDLQLALYVCYELHYQGFAGVDDRWEWQPALLRFRARLEERFERDLRALVPRRPAVPPQDLPRALAHLAATAEGPSLATYVQRNATLEQFTEFVVHRSIYNLKEADPHTWVIPRVRGAIKAALVEIQADEYGDGRPEWMHSALFAETMRGLGLDDGYGAFLDDVPAITLATNNLMSMFGLHRRWRGAALGHLAAFELTSSLPNRRYGNGLRRLLGDAAPTRFYDEHVTADAVHEQIALHDMCGTFAALEPDAVPDVLFGAACCLALDRLFAEHVLDRWGRGETSLYRGGAAVHRPERVGA